MIEIAVTGSRNDFSYDYQFSSDAGVTAIWGRSGAGKTSLLRIIAGLHRPDDGEILVDNEIWYKQSDQIFLRPEARRTGYVFQNSTLFNHLTVERNLTYANWAAGRRPPVQLDELTDLLGLDGLLSRRPSTLSGGEQRRVAIGRAICSDPKVLLLDEPFSGLDETRTAEISDYIQKTVARLKMPVLLVSHNRLDVVRLASKVIIVEDGNARKVSSLDRLFSRTHGDREQSMLIAKSLGSANASGLAELDVEGQRLTLVSQRIGKGGTVRILVDPEDVLLSTDAKIRISARNRLRCTVREIRLNDDGSVTIILGVGKQRLSARITPEAVSELGLQPGGECIAVLKSTSLGQQAYVAPE